MDKWTQASLPVHMSRLGFRSAVMLAPSAYLASTAATLLLQNAILNDPSPTILDPYVEEAVDLWKAMTKQEVPEAPAISCQRIWNLRVATVVHQDLLSRCVSEVDVAKLKAAGAPHAGDWLNAPPIAGVGFRPSDEVIRVAVGYRLGSVTCQPHTCMCGIKENARGLHGLSGRKSTPGHTRHSQLNDLIWRAVRIVQIPAVKEPVSLTREDRMRPDGATLIPWAQDKPLAWDVTVPDTFAPSHLLNISLTAGAAADKAAASKTAKYEKMRGTHLFLPVAIETGGPWNAQATGLVQEIRRRLTIITSNPL